MSNGKDPYQILGVARSAAPDEIKKAYRRLAKQHHPDRNPNDKGAGQRFKEIQAAYEVLGDPQRRAEYDRYGAGGPRPDVHAWSSRPVGAEDVAFDFNSLGDLSSIFEQFFSRAGGGMGGMGGMGGARTRRRTAAPRRPAERGADLETSVELSLEEAVRGTTRELRLSTGEPGAHEEVIQFRVPPGVNDGQRIRVRGKGQEGAGGRGDLLIRCHMRPHPYFRREDHDILLEVPVTVAEAALGAPVEIPTLEGPTIVKIPPGTSSGTKLRLRGRGVNDQRSGVTGDMYAIVRIMLPKTLSERARTLFQELGSELAYNPREALGWGK
jgi:curved DNA-binding protein